MPSNTPAQANLLDRARMELQEAYEAHLRGESEPPPEEQKAKAQERPTMPREDREALITKYAEDRLENFVTAIKKDPFVYREMSLCISRDKVMQLIEKAGFTAAASTVTKDMRRLMKRGVLQPDGGSHTYRAAISDDLAEALKTLAQAAEDSRNHLFFGIAAAWHSVCAEENSKDRYDGRLRSYGPSLDITWKQLHQLLALAFPNRVPDDEAEVSALGKVYYDLNMRSVRLRRQYNRLCWDNSTQAKAEMAALQEEIDEVKDRLEQVKRPL